MSETNSRAASRVRTCRQRKARRTRWLNGAEALGRRLAFESLEVRQLLSAAPFYSARNAAAANELSLRLDDRAGGPWLTLHDAALGQDVAAAALDEAAWPLLIEGSAWDDVFRVELDLGTLESSPGAVILFDGLQGQDTLRGPLEDTEWSITGPDAGRLGAGAVQFTSVEQLLGRADNQDTFSLAPGGSLSGGLDGGPAGYDTLAIVGGSYTDVAYEATGPDSGVIWLDGVPLRYFGLEPVTDNANAVNRVLTASGSADAIIIADGAGEQITVSADNGTFETHDYDPPSA